MNTQIKTRSLHAIIPLLFLVVCVLLACSTIAGAQSTTASPEKLIKGPMIQNVQMDRATIVWVTQSTRGQFQKASGGDSKLIAEPVYHEAELSGLEPGSGYNYDLASYGVAVKGSFATPPKGNAPVFFIAYGDTRTRHDVHQKVAANILAEKPAFVLHTGDMISNGLKSEDWDRFFEISFDLLRNTPFYPVLGNHERNAPVYFKYFSFPGGNSRYYSFDWGDTHIIALDTTEFGDTPQAQESFFQIQLGWLKEDLRRNTKPLVFVFQHHPLYTAMESRRKSASRLAAKFEPVLLEGGVTAVFAGHDHNYQHHAKDGLHHIVTGGGGAPLYDVSPIPGITLKAVKTENYIRIHTEGTRVKMQAVDIEGKILDEFELEARQKSAPKDVKAIP